MLLTLKPLYSLRFDFNITKRGVVLIMERIKKQNLLRIFIVIISAIAIILPAFLINVSAGGEPAGDVIFNYPYDQTSPPVNLEDSIAWTKYDHNSGQGGYDNAYTEATSLALNGVGTPDHAVFVNNVSGKIESGFNDSITFYGYGVEPYMDYVFTDLGPSRGNSFILRPVWMNFHSSIRWSIHPPLRKAPRSTAETGIEEASAIPFR